MLWHSEREAAPQNTDVVRLWWIARSNEEIQQWTAEIVAVGGRVVKVDQSGSHTFDFVCEVTVKAARETLGYDDDSLEDCAIIADDEIDG